MSTACNLAAGLLFLFALGGCDVLSEPDGPTREDFLANRTADAETDDAEESSLSAELAGADGDSTLATEPPDEGDHDSDCGPMIDAPELTRIAFGSASPAPR